MINIDYSKLLAIELGTYSLQPKLEYKFHPSRNWRFDLAFPDLMLGIEIEGGIWTGGRHVRGQGYENDCIKYNSAIILGWNLLRFTPAMVRKGEALSIILYYIDIKLGRVITDE